MDNINVQIGTFEGMPIFSTLSEEDIKQASEDGLSINDLIHIEKIAYSCQG